MIEDEVEVPGARVGLHGGVGRSEYGNKGVEVRGVWPLCALAIREVSLSIMT